MDIYNLFYNRKLDTHSTIPLYKQIADLLTEYITCGRLQEGAKLPPERELASLFQVSRTTAINAYHYLEKKGLLQMKIGSGTFVAETKDSVTDASPLIWPQIMTPYTPNFSATLLKDLVANINREDMISFAGGIPDPDYYPLESFLKNSTPYDPVAFSHTPTEGYRPLREWMVSQFHQMNMQAQVSNLLIDSGSQQGLYLLGKALISPGDYVVLEMPAYMGAIQVFHRAGAKLLPFYLESFSLSALADYFVRYRPKLMYVNPTYQNPTGKCLLQSQREELLQLASQHQVLLVEDNSYGQLHYGHVPPPPIKTLDTKGIVVYLSTFSKVLFPGLRIGAILAHEALIHRLAMEKQLVDLHSSNLSQWFLYQYLRSGSLSTHLEKMQIIYRSRRDAMAAALRTYCSNYLDFDLPEGGFYIWCRTKFPFNTGRLLQEASRKGVAIVPGDVFYLQQENHSHFRLCFATHPEKQITTGIQRLSQVLFSLSTDERPDSMWPSHQPLV